VMSAIGCFVRSSAAGDGSGWGGRGPTCAAGERVKGGGG
jgi:hypothetical protein